MSGLVKKLVRRCLPEQRRLAVTDMARVTKRVDELERRVQRLLTENLRTAWAEVGAPVAVGEAPHSELNRHESKVYSQNNEDGVLMWLFTAVGATDRRFIEFGIGAGEECNTTNLALTFGWSGLQMDCNPWGVGYARHFFRKMLGPKENRVTVTQQTVTPENVNDVFARHGFKGEIDLLSIDIDSNDYHVWKAIEVVRPRVVVCEYNATFGPELPATMRYREGFDRWAAHPHGWFFGAGLGALTHLSHEKGYILAGCESTGVNAFFVRRDVAEGIIEEVEPARAWYPNRGRIRVMTQDEQFDSIRGMDYELVA